MCTNTTYNRNKGKKQRTKENKKDAPDEPTNLEIYRKKLLCIRVLVLLDIHFHFNTNSREIQLCVCVVVIKFGEHFSNVFVFLF